MIPSPLAAFDKVMVGNAAAWHLAFHKEGADGRVAGDPVFECGSDWYNAEIQASLPSGLEGGVYRIVIEGLTDGHYGKLAPETGDPPTVARLYLYWRDVTRPAGPPSLLPLATGANTAKAANLADHLVAELRIAPPTRRTGARRHETVIEGRERVHAVLAAHRLCADLDAADPLRAARTLAEGRGIDVSAHDLPARPGAAPAGEDAAAPLKLGRTGLDTMLELERRMLEACNKHGRGLFLIRDGQLAVGCRDIGAEIAAAKPLTLRTGLVEAAHAGVVPTDPAFDPCTHVGSAPPTRDQFRLTLKGRPDLKPGRVVKFKPHQADVRKTVAKGGLFGALAGAVTDQILPSLGGDDLGSDATLLYVHGVEHRFGRTTGFVTTVTGVTLKDAADAWDEHTEAERPAGGTTDASATGEQRAARAVDRRIAGAVSGQRLPEVGEVRRATATGRDEPPGQTLSLWCGLDGADGRANQARRLRVRRPSRSRSEGSPYLTPFAWNGCGLVLPRYPGTRMLVGFRNGAGEDPVALGAFWESGTSPDKAEAGDWWLILPVDVPADRRAAIDDGAAPQPHAGKVTHDLTDAEGRRAIEVKHLTITVGAATLQGVGSRPKHGPDNIGVTIEHEGAKVQIKDDGTVVIHAAKNIELDAPGETISLKAATINLEADNVNVKVSGAMNVSG
jgi:hypothetical protein